MNKSLLNKFDPLSLSLIGFALLLSLYSFYFLVIMHISDQVLNSLGYA